MEKKGMNPKKWQELLDRELFIVTESSLSDFVKRPYRLQFGANVLCISGEAEFTVNVADCLVKSGTIVFFLPNNLLNIHRISPDFRVMAFFFSEAFFREAAFRLELPLFRYIVEHPFILPDPQFLPSARHWMQMSEYTYLDRKNIHRVAITRNRLRNVFMEFDDKLCRGMVLGKGEMSASLRRNDLAHRFMELVHHHCCRQHDVAFYADRLCITTRYLSSVTRSVLNRSAKEMIDEVLLLEIKMRLRSTDLSIQEIADETCFPDQSYLGRFFKRHTGQSPTAYRLSGGGK